MPRLFTGLQLPADVRLRLSMLRGDLDGACWVAAENMHLTLRFFGDVIPQVADELADLLDGSGLAEFELTIDGTGAFGGRNPTSVYAALAPSAELDRLQKAHERIARIAGLPPAAHPFTPHITLARLRGTRPEAVARFLGATAAFRLPPLRIERFVLLSSRPGTGGGPYAVEADYALGSFDYEDEVDPVRAGPA